MYSLHYVCMDIVSKSGDLMPSSLHMLYVNGSTPICCMTKPCASALSFKYQFLEKFDVKLIILYSDHKNWASLQSHLSLITTHCKILCVECSPNQLRYRWQARGSYNKMPVKASSLHFVQFRLFCSALFLSGVHSCLQLGFDLCMHWVGFHHCWPQVIQVRKPGVESMRTDNTDLVVRVHFCWWVMS